MILNHSLCSEEDFLTDVKKNAKGSGLTKLEKNDYQAT